MDEVKRRRWRVDDGCYKPLGATADEVESGVYVFSSDGYGVYLRPASLVSDTLIELPDPTCAEVLAKIDKFWTNEVENRYRSHGLLYKRSIGLYGAPGAGKTATLILIGRHLIAQKGLVILFNDYAPDGLAMLRKTEPERKIVCLMEDLDEIIGDSESEVLSLLDGESQIDGVVYLATTNHYKKLPSTLVNRPSRFDEWILVKMPSPAARRAYLCQITQAWENEELAKWVADTKGFSVAHLKELAIAVLCLQSPYDETLKRLRTMLESKDEE